jgi:hypothetical protein
MMNRLTILFLAVSLSTAAALAEQSEERYMRLARLSYIDGQVSYQHVADVEWSAASINLPLEPGDRIYTGRNAKAEIEFDDGSIFRMAGNTDIEVLNLNENIIQLRILVGLSSLTNPNGTDFEIDTPAAAFNTLGKGNYRFGVLDNGDSDAAVRIGELEAANNSFSRRIRAGEWVRVPASGSARPKYSLYDRRDEWDEWNDRRNADMNSYASSGYLPANVYIGASDLHRHGRWVNVGIYGAAWVPYSIGVSWTPYSVGRWCYRPVFGWTWISYEPWGWLPYHYGRWYRSAVYGWCWLPGPGFALNFWSPALVSFYSGPGWVSWCPLGPGDYYSVSHYHYNHRAHGHYMGQIHQLYTRSADNHYYRYDRAAFRTVKVDHFRNGSFRQGHDDSAERTISQPWRQGELVRDRLNIKPTSTSFKANPDNRAIQPERRDRERTVVVRNDPGSNLRGQNQFIRIAEHTAASPTSRSESAQSVQRERVQEAEQQNRSRPIMRSREIPQKEHESRESRNQQVGKDAKTPDRRAENYRWTGAAENNDEKPSSPKRSAILEQQTQETAPAESRGNLQGDSAVKSGERGVPSYRYMGSSETIPKQPSAVERGTTTESRIRGNAGSIERNSPAGFPERTAREQKQGTPASTVTTNPEPPRSGSLEQRANSSRVWGYRNAMMESSPREVRAPGAGSPESERPTSRKITRAEREANAASAREPRSSTSGSGGERSSSRSNAGSRIGSDSGSAENGGGNEQSGRSGGSRGEAKPRR